jgi:hypothetical protein
MEANVEVEGVGLGITRSEVIKDDVTSNLGKLDVLGPAICVGLSVCEAQSAVCLIAVSND